MFEHFKILIYLLLLLCTFWLIFYVNNTYRLYPYRYIKVIRSYTIVLIIPIILRFLFFYAGENLQHYIEPSLSPVYIKILTFLIASTTIVLIYIMLNILMSFNDRSFSKSQNLKVIAIGFLIISFYIFSSFLSENTNQIYIWLNSVTSHFFIFNIIINSLEFLIIISFYLIWSNKIIDKDKKRIAKLFALFYIICNSISFLALLLIIKIEMPYNLFLLVQIIIPFLFILTPFLWIKLVFVKYAQTMSKLLNSSVLIQSIYNDHKISEREKEIIQLILNGKGNNEIKELLFISYHTVKNHLSNIYRKLNVRNRHELVHFFLKSKDV